jgi:hypothetical protein
MIVAGGYRSHVLTQGAPELTCSACQHQGKITLNVFSQCVHVFFIPFFPVGKIGYAKCQQCNSQLDQKEMSAEMKHSLLQAKSAARVPLWQFSGLVMATLLPLSLPLIGLIVGDREDTPIPVEYEITDENKKTDDLSKDDLGGGYPRPMGEE